MGRVSEVLLTKEQINERVIDVLGSFYSLPLRDGITPNLGNVHSRALIILLDDCINSYFNEWNMISATRQNFDPTDRNTVWGNQLRYSANWVRHHSDWFDQYMLKIKLKVHESQEDCVDISLDNLGLNNNSKKCLGGLMEMIKEKNPLTFFRFDSDISIRIVKHLKLDDPDAVLMNIEKVIG